MTRLAELPLVLQLDAYGNPVKWINYEQACYYEAKGAIAWSMGAVEFDLHGGTCAKTGQQSILTINTIIAVTSKNKLTAKAMQRCEHVPLTNKTLFRRDQNICAYCGYEFTSAKLTRDHIIPTSRGGLNTWMNVVTACADCNKVKDNKLLEETSMGLLYVPYVPNKSELLILENRRILADQMEFLMKRVPKSSRLRN